jgi:hypothetical protein
MEKIYYFKLFFPIILFLSIIYILVFPFFNSGLKQDGTYHIYGGHDAFWHLSLISEISRKIPPDFPGIAGQKLYNYNISSDFIIGILYKITKLPTDFLYFKFGSALYIIILLIGIYKLSLQITHKYFLSIIPVFTTVFSSSATFIFLFLDRNKSIWHGNSFMLDQTYDQMINIHSILGFCLIIWTCYYILLYFQLQKLRYGLVSTFLIGFLFSVKSYYAIPLSLGFIISLIFGRKGKFTHKMIIFIFLGIFSIIFLLPSIWIPDNIQNQQLLFKPGYILIKMIEDFNRFPDFQLLMKLQFYQNINNYPKILFIMLQLLLYYLVGNFWLRIAGLYYLYKNRIKIGNFFIFILASIALSVIIPLLIVPSSNFYNAIQFGQVSVLLLGLFFGIFLLYIKRKAVVLTLILLSSVTFFIEWPKIISEQTYVLNSMEFDAFSYIKNNTIKNSIFLVDPNLSSSSFMAVTGLGQRRTFYTGGDIAKLLGYNTKERESDNNAFFKGKFSLQETTDFIKRSKAGYILSDSKLLKLYQIPNHIIYSTNSLQIIKINQL